VVAEIYEDNDVSAYPGKSRPGYRRMCEDIKAGWRDGVIVWHNDRLHRNTRELEDFIDLVEATNVAVATVKSGDYDLTTTTGRGHGRIACALARLESGDKSRRNKRQALQAAQEGRRSGGGTGATLEPQVGKGFAELLPVQPEEVAHIRAQCRCS
jgi:DNA invertase Pin-like site-specific DNA recombinase